MLALEALSLEYGSGVDVLLRRVTGEIEREMDRSGRWDKDLPDPDLVDQT
jgi:hypothetical protein